MKEKNIRVLLTKIGLDGLDRGLVTVAMASNTDAYRYEIGVNFHLLTPFSAPVSI